MNKLLLLSDPSDADVVPWETILERLKEFLHLLSTLYSNLINQVQNLFSSGNIISSDALAVAIPVFIVVYFCAFCCFRAAARGPRMVGSRDGPVLRVKRGGGLFSFHPKRVIV